MARRPIRPDETDINITPMLDVVFIMLIFFIATASFTQETGVSIDRPVADRAVALGTAAILIGVRPNDELWMAKRRVDLIEIRQLVERAKAENPESGVVIVADHGSSIGMVTRVLDQVKLAGVQAVSLSAEHRAPR